MTDDNGDTTIELNRRRVLGGLITVGGAAAAAGAGTYAWFSDEEESNDNTVTAGTLDLTGANDEKITAKDMVPSQRIPSSGSNTISVTYDGSSTVTPVELDFSTSLSEPTETNNTPDQSVTDLGNQLDVNTAELVQSGTPSTTVNLKADHGVSTVADLDGLSLDAALSLSPSDSVDFNLAFTFNQNAGNDFQGDGITIEATFTAEQEGRDSP